jgi:transcriptional regulator with XRE-family HTH domain
MSLEEAAHKVGIDRSGLGKIESGKTVPLPTTRKDLFDYYKVTEFDFRIYAKASQDGPLNLNELSENGTIVAIDELCSVLSFIDTLAVDVQDKILKISTLVMNEARENEQEFLDGDKEAKQLVEHMLESEESLADFASSMAMLVTLQRTRLILRKMQVAVSLMNPDNYHGILRSILDLNPQADEAADGKAETARQATRAADGLDTV